MPLRMEVLSDFVKFDTKNKWNIQTDIYFVGSGQILF